MEGGALDHRAAAAGPAVPVGAPWTSWLPPLLWPGADVWIGRGSPPEAFGNGRRFAILPSAQDPRVLVPLGGGRSAAAPFLGNNEAFGAIDRARRSAIALGMALGLGGIASRDRVVVAGADVLAQAIAPVAGEDGGYVVHLGPRDRLNVKPVVRALDRRGRAVAFAKVPRDPLTVSLVATETAALEAWGAAPPTSFEVPSVLDRFVLGGHDVALVSALPQPLLRRGRPIPVEVFREIAERGGVTSEVLGASGFWASLVRRLEGADDDVRRALDEVEGIASDRSIRFGAWHGDLAPWNVAWADGRVMVWDWERARAPVPIGFDVLHHRIAPGLGAPDPVAFVRRAVAAAAPDLLELGCTRADLGTLATLSVLERCARIREAERAGVVSTRSWRFARAALAAVEPS